jgi:hypothetical protein
VGVIMHRWISYKSDKFFLSSKQLSDSADGICSVELMGLQLYLILCRPAASKAVSVAVSHLIASSTFRPTLNSNDCSESEVTR